MELTVAGQALVAVGNTMPAWIAEELGVDGGSIYRLVAVGQRIAGSYDDESGRIDVRTGVPLLAAPASWRSDAARWTAPLPVDARAYLAC